MQRSENWFNWNKCAWWLSGTDWGDMDIHYMRYMMMTEMVRTRQRWCLKKMWWGWLVQKPVRNGDTATQWHSPLLSACHKTPLPVYTALVPKNRQSTWCYRVQLMTRLSRRHGPIFRSWMAQGVYRACWRRLERWPTCRKYNSEEFCCWRTGLTPEK